MLGCPAGGRGIWVWGSCPYPRPCSVTDLGELPREGPGGGTGLYVGGFFQATGTASLSWLEPGDMRCHYEGQAAPTSAQGLRASGTSKF